MLPSWIDANVTSESCEATSKRDDAVTPLLLTFEPAASFTFQPMEVEAVT